MSNQLLNSGDTPILLGTTNSDKQETLRWMLDGLPLSPVTPSQIGLQAAPTEEGDTHEAIAKAKAVDWAQASSTLSIASDGGLVLPALGDHWESRYTHRFAGPEADNSRRLQRLMELLQPYRGPQREATWIEAVAIADQGGLLASWEVKGATGIIAESSDVVPQDSGFWAFSVWYFPKLGKTYDQLSLQERELLADHWGTLRRKVQRFFGTYFDGIR